MVDENEADDSLAGVAGGLSSSAQVAIQGATLVGGLGGGTLVGNAALNRSGRHYRRRMANEMDGYSVFGDKGEVIARTTAEPRDYANTIKSLEKYRDGKVRLTHHSSWTSDSREDGPIRVDEYRYDDDGILTVRRTASGRTLESRLQAEDGRVLTIYHEQGEMEYTHPDGYTETVLKPSRAWLGQDGRSPLSEGLPQPNLSESTKSESDPSVSGVGSFTSSKDSFDGD